MVPLVIGGILVVVGAALFSFARAWETVDRTPLELKPVVLMNKRGRWVPVGVSGMATAVAGVIILFVGKWYAGLAGLLAMYLLSNIILRAWLAMYESFFDRYVAATVQQKKDPTVLGYVLWNLGIGRARRRDSE